MLRGEGADQRIIGMERAENLYGKRSFRLKKENGFFFDLKEEERLATTRLMPLHIGKGQTAGDAIKRALGYVKDPMKTENGVLVASYGCTPQTAEAEFMLMRREDLTITGRRRGKDDVLAYHLRQSFKPGEITPEEANRIGCELAKRFTHGDHAFIVATHTNTSSVQHVLCKGRF